MTRRKLPIGMQTFRDIRESNCYYVDKTAYIGRLLDEGKHYFLSRPRRFGKSLFLDTCKELFEGNEPLFEGLAIHDRWDWSVRHPVLRLSFGSGHFKEPGYLHEEVMDQLQILEEESEVVAHHDAAPARFRHLIRTLHQRAGRPIAILVDEYDKPILDALGRAGGRPRQPRLPPRPLRGRQGQRRAHPVQLHHRREQVLQGQPVLRPQQPQGHHAESALLGHLRLHGGGPRHRVRAGARRPGPRPGPGLVQRLQLAGRGEGL